MQKHISPRWQIAELLIPALTLALLLFYTYGAFIRASYIGLYFNPTTGEVVQIFDPTESPNWGHIVTDPLAKPDHSTTSTVSPDSLHIGDMLLKVGDITWEEYYKNSWQGLFNKVEDGEIIPVTVKRAGVETTIQWEIPGFNQAEFFSRFFNIWWLAYIFWFFGVTTQIFVRPKDMRWGLLVALNYLMGLWLIFGVLSARHLWGSSILLHAVTWALLPIYLQFHWLFPKPLTPISGFVSKVFLGVSLPFIVGEFLQLFSKPFYAFGFLLTAAGVVVLQTIHFIKHRDQRREVGLVVLSVLLALLPSLALSASSAIGNEQPAGVLGLLTLPLLPLTYFYIIYRNQLGGLEMRMNRFISLYVYLILLSVILILLVNPIVSLRVPGEMSILFALGLSIFTAIVSVIVFPAFQAFVEKRILGIRLLYQNLTETYSDRITSSESIQNLLRLLNEKVLPQFLVRQFAFIHTSDNGLKTLLVKNVAENQLPNESDINRLTSQAGIYIPVFSSSDDWIRLILPLKAGDRFIGFWLLGRRDPDDFYPQAEIQILQAIANQTAIALSNLIYAEQLRGIYLSDIDRYEKERAKLGWELHDSVLHELAKLRASIDEASLPAEFLDSYEEATSRLREIVSDLRPAMLTYGIVPGITELADNLMERSGDKIRIEVNIQSNGERLPETVEKHLFRIIQQACENATRHGGATHISIFGVLDSQKINLTIKDNGAGFDVPPDLSHLLRNNHFGLANMVERGRVIGADVQIQSRPNAGTEIHIAQVTGSENNIL